VTGKVLGKEGQRAIEYHEPTVERTILVLSREATNDLPD
jgi:hypothetical protein